MANRDQQLEEFLESLQGVVSAQVVRDQSGEIIEVHVLAKEREPKQVVRDVQSALAAEFGLNFDHKKISVALLKGDDAPPLRSNQRLMLESSHFAKNGTQGEARVVLRKGEETFTGTATGPASTGNRLRLMAEAALAAAKNSLQSDAAFSVEDIATTPIAGGNAVLVAVTVIRPAGEEILLGSSLVRGDERESTVRAALDAINRRLTLFYR